MNKRLLRRVEKIERALEPADKGACWRFPCPDGSFIEVPGNLTVVDIIAMAAARERDHLANLPERQPKATKSDKIPRNRGAK